MNVAWAMFEGGSRSTKPCVFPCKVAAAGDEWYLACAAGAAGVASVVSRIDSFYVFCNNSCSCVKGFAIESGSLEFDFFRWIHMYADCLARSHYI